MGKKQKKTTFFVLYLLFLDLIVQVRAAGRSSLGRQDFYYLRSPNEIEFRSSWPRLKQSATSTAADYSRRDYYPRHHKFNNIFTFCCPSV